MMKHSIALCLTFGCLQYAVAKPILMEGNLDQWESQTFGSATEYKTLTDASQGIVIKAESHKSASGYTYQQEINLNKTPVLQWQWAVEQFPEAAASVEMPTQDFALRVVVSRKGLFSGKKAIHYVWSDSQPVDTSWDIDGNNKVLVASNGQQGVRNWQTVFRHIQSDWQTLFNERIEDIHSIMIMTDSDQTQGRAVGYYGDMQTLSVSNIAENQK